MKSLVLTNHFFDYTGSEVLALEVSEILLKNKYKVDFYANYLDNNSPLLHNAGFNIINDISFIKISEYDFIWSQHGTIGIFNLEKISENCKVVSAHLSSFEEFEHIGILAATIYEFYIFANSAETKSKLHELGVPEENIINFKNSFPVTNYKNVHRKRILRKIAIVSNHMAEELLIASEMLKSTGIEIKIFGKNHTSKRIDNSVLEDFDAVISIGKTVQYALAMGIPVYCYDHFGGPGWLTNENFTQAEYHNFSGRCCNTKKESHTISIEIISNFDLANSFSSEIQKYSKKNYNLEKYITNASKGKFTKHKIDSSTMIKIAKNSILSNANIVKRLSNVAFSNQ